MLALEIITNGLIVISLLLITSSFDDVLASTKSDDNEEENLNVLRTPLHQIKYMRIPTME